MAFHVADEFIDVVVYDDSKVDIPEPVLPKRLSVLQAIFSSDGKANTILDFGAHTTTIKEFFGDDMDDIDKYGQGGLNVLHAAKGGAMSQIARLLPKTAKTSFVNIAVQITKIVNMPVYKLNESGRFEYTPEGKRVIAKHTVKKEDPPGSGTFVEVEEDWILPFGFETKIVKTGFDAVNGAVSYRSVEIDPLTLKPVKETKQIKRRNPVTLELETVEVEVDKETIIDDPANYNTANRIVVPLYTMSYYGPGRCGNDYSHKIVNDRQRDLKVDDGRRYILKLEKKDSYGNIISVGEETYFSLNPAARISKGSKLPEALGLVYKNVLDNGNENKIQLKTFGKNYNVIANFLNPLIGEDSIKLDNFANVDDIDFINCTTKLGFPSRTVILDTTDNTTDFLWTSIALSGGHDGELEPVGTKFLVESEVPGVDPVIKTVASEEERQKVKDNLLMEFYKGQIDIRLFDERLVDSDIVFDANYSKPVKKLLLQKFRQIRPDIMVIVDCGFTINVYDAIREVKDLYSLVDGETGYTAAIITQAGTTTDIEIPLRVTATYDYAYGLAKCYDNFGTFTVFCGYDTGKVSTMKFDWYPMKDEFNTQIGPLTKLGCIFAMEVVKHKVWAYMSEETMYATEYSKLKSVRNGMIIGDAIRLGKQVLIKHVYERRGAEYAMKKAAEELSEASRDRYPDNVSTVYNMYRTELDRKTDNTSCQMIVTFPDIGKTFSLIISARRVPIE